MILADYTFHFTVDYVMYPAAVAAAGMAFAIFIRIVRKFDLSAFPFWIPLMVVGAGAFGFGVADMPGGVPLHKASESEMVIKQWEIERRYEEPRMLPRWADGMLCVGGIGMFLCGLVLMICRLYEKYGNHSVSPRIAAKWQNELDIIKKMILDCGGVSTNTYTVLETGIKKSIGDWAASCHTRMAALELQMDKIVSDFDRAFPAANARWEKWDSVQKEHGERLNAIQNKLRELQTANNSDLLAEVRTEQISLQKMMEQALKYPARPVAEGRPLSNPPVLLSGLSGGSQYPTCPVVVTSGSISWPVVASGALASGSIGGGAWEVLASVPSVSVKPSEWVKWSDFKPEIGSKINWASQGDGCISGNGVYVVVEDWDERAKKPKFISAKWVKDNAKIVAQWRYVDGKPTPTKKEIERIDGWVRWRDEKPKVGRKMRWGDTKDKPDPEWWGGGDFIVTDKFLQDVDLVTDNHAQWWKYVDEPQIDKLKADGWISVADRLPRSNEVANCHDMQGGQVAILGCKEATAYFVFNYCDTFYKIGMGTDGDAQINPTHWKPIT